MSIGNENALSYRLFGARTACPKCRNRMDYGAGAELARQYGIYDNVVVCGGCRHVYTYVLIPGSLTLQDDVTERYPGVRAEALRKEQEEEKAGNRTGKKRGMLSVIFGKKRGAAE